MLGAGTRCHVRGGGATIASTVVGVDEMIGATERTPLHRRRTPLFTYSIPVSSSRRWLDGDKTDKTSHKTIGRLLQLLQPFYGPGLPG